ncbi:hypothetical protein H0H81_004328 [Sphagnurus paluster]|uniref:Uncharacterized protein n=1 Tax=Sphagnurus paluster TaxID=117069 RepID=A0A9P7FS21_9AGAR|nr:hypothetical protein H0H81_004328 [Sphagnurus paluster]
MTTTPTENTNKRPPGGIDLYKEHAFIKNKRAKFSSNAPFTPTYVTSLLTQTADPTGMYASRIQGRKMLLDNPARESSAKKEVDEKRARQKAQKERKRNGKIGKREAKEKGLWRFDKTQAKFNLFIPLHHLWMGYMSELLGLVQPPASGSPSAQAMPASSSMHPKLVKADFHGSIITVRQSKHPCLVGLSGIVIHETENAFKIVTRKDKVKRALILAIPLISSLIEAFAIMQSFRKKIQFSPLQSHFTPPSHQHIQRSNRFLSQTQ